MLRIWPLVAAALAALALVSPARAQDLVVNGNFEAFSQCPSGPGLIDDWLDDWHRTNIASTDYFNTCDFAGGVPARNGAGHIGFLAWDPSGDYREYATGRFTAPLEASHRYRLDFWIRPDPNWMHWVEEIGAYFSATEPTWPNPGAAPVAAQVETSGTPLNDDTTWTLVSLTYDAAGGEQYVTIGNFRDDASTTLGGRTCCGQHGAYYHVDDVSLVDVDVVAPMLEVACRIGVDTCAIDGAATGDGRRDFGEELELVLTLTNTGATDIVRYGANLTVTNAFVSDPPFGLVEVPIIGVGAGGSVDVPVRLFLPDDDGTVPCGAVVDFHLVNQSSDAGPLPDDDVAACTFAIGDPAGECGACAPPCLWRADLTDLSPVTPVPGTLFGPADADGLTVLGAGWQCPLASGDLERDANALRNGVPLSYYQVDRAVSSLRLGKLGTTIRFTY